MSSVDVWCKGSGDEQMQDVIVEEDAVRFCRVTTEEGGGGGGPGSTGGGPITMDKDEKRMRREIANSNERRRMQSINAGFQSLRQMLPHHEGEKLSKAAILQQTAEYIYTLEQEKTRLLSQNCALKRDRERDQQDHTAEQQQTQTQTQIVPTGAAVTTVAKKRKIDAIVAVSDSSDEGLGSMSPEPVGLMQVVNGQTIVTAAAAGNGRITAASGPTINVSAKDYLELKHQLEVERRQKAIFEERLKALERQIYPARVLYPDVLEANEAIEEITVAAAIPAKPVAKISREMENVQLITLDSGLLAKKQLVAVCSGGPEVIEETIVPISKTLNIVPVKEEKVFIKRSRSRSPTIEPVIPQQQQPQPLPQQQQQTTIVTLPPKKNRFPTILEAAIKAEPKVEVERINSPSSIVVSDDHLHLTTNSSKLVTSQQQQTNSRINTCRHNLETIVEAIRHLEGDAFDSVAPVQQQQQQLTISRPAAVAVQEVPLALTTSTKQKERDHRQSQLEPYLKFRTTPAAVAATAVTTSTPPSSATSASSSNPSGHPAIVSVSITPTLSPAAVTAVQQQQQQHQQTASQILQQHQQCRPGVIVVKQNS